MSSSQDRVAATCAERLRHGNFTSLFISPFQACAGMYTFLLVRLAKAFIHRHGHYILSQVEEVILLNSISLHTHFTQMFSFLKTSKCIQGHEPHRHEVTQVNKLLVAPSLSMRRVTAGQASCEAEVWFLL